ncbi:unnamed protein product [Prunus armeniaca]|uniref:DUF4283 domain-containing protein n=1 Tax=Prunus armeniaca TaxID=36596 RepID=A0A6J5VXV8_PRUAR|nr:unnamed protein product [Prunus armeniaca]
MREVDASMASFWVKMHGVPLLNMTTMVAKKIGYVLGQVLEVDHTKEEECIGRFLGVRICLDVRQSLMRGTFVEFPEEGATWRETSQSTRGKRGLERKGKRKNGVGRYGRLKFLGPHGITEASPTNFAEPPLPHGGAFQISIESGIAFDLNMAAVVEEGSIVQRTTHESLAIVRGDLGFQFEALTHGSDPFNLGPLIFGQPDISTTGGVGSLSKRGKEKEESGRMDKRRCAGNRLASDCVGACNMGSRRELTFDDTLIQEAKTNFRYPHAP